MMLESDPAWIISSKFLAQCEGSDDCTGTTIYHPLSDEDSQSKNCSDSRRFLWHNDIMFSNGWGNFNVNRQQHTDYLAPGDFSMK